MEDRRAESPTMGFKILQMTIEWIDEETRTAGGTDQMGKPRKVRWDLQRAKGSKPHVGETWVIDRALGYWSLAAVAVPPPPVVTGSTLGNPALISLLQVLHAEGIIEDQTS